MKTSKFKLSSFAAIAVATLIVGGCAAAPEVRLDSARGAISEARSAGAEQYAKDQLRQAEDYLADAVRLQAEGEAEKASDAVAAAIREAKAAGDKAAEAVIAAKESAAERAARERRQAAEAERR
ncbi:MAG: hypothetical protein KC466_09195, partial [Myxococcales bacterium]|nr:hypothetical protein [Myxococcales bacterium]